MRSLNLLWLAVVCALALSASLGAGSELSLEAELEAQPPATVAAAAAAAPAATNTGACLNDCSGNGVCRGGECMCVQPFTGRDCSEAACPNQCSGRGVCDRRTGICACYNKRQLAAIFPYDNDGPVHEFGFTGADCSLKACFTDCGASEGRGKCNMQTGRCECAKGFWGPEGMHCNSVLCSDPCSHHGFCVDGRCVCDVARNRMSGWTGEKCEKPVCPNHCFEAQGLGQCIDGACQCAPEWYGDDCSQRKCPENYSPLAWIGGQKTMCSGHGDCVEGVCKCAAGFSGADCSVRSCPSINRNGTDRADGPPCSGHGTCMPNGACVCNAGYIGVDCFERSCSSDCGEKKGRGFCDGESGRCECKEGWYGVDCSHRKCDDSCNGHGKCLDDMCACDPGFQGVHCELPICGNNCSYAEGQGQCIDKQCKCNPGFNGAECLWKDCALARNPFDDQTYGALQTCAGNGVCVAGKCECNPAWKGELCTERVCPHNCSDVGVCSLDAKCTCPTGDKDGRGGFKGQYCEQSLCPLDCGESKKQGVCSNGQCKCKEPWALPDCMYEQCPLGLPPLTTPFSTPVPCSGSGKCVKGACVCMEGFTGPNCAQRTCPKGCTDATHGTCMPNGVCMCKDQFTGEDCSVKACPNGCSKHGHCVGKDQCKCDARWTGERCEIVKCPNGCSGSGECVRFPANGTSPAMEKCVCDEGYRGVDCSQPVCLPLEEDGVTMCKGKGRCVIDAQGRHVCRCDPPYHGQDCGNTMCNKTCNFHGTCTDLGTCQCDKGWFGPNCERTGDCMPFDCFGRGTCVAGPKNEPICKCEAPFGGPDCSLCMHNCTGHGQCTPNGCKCVDGWLGELCDRREDCDPKDCGGKGHGTCVVDAQGSPVCKCIPPWTDFDCMECTLTCNEHGSCNEKGGCTCDKGWFGEHCDRFGECPNKCSDRGTCVGDDIGDPICKCFDGYGGLDCGSLVCNATCPAHSTCLDGQCTCVPGWTGDACDERDDCPQNCNDRGTCMGDSKGKPYCKCAQGYGGPACQFKTCNLECSDHGSCFMVKGQAKCRCDAGWGGKDCAEITCEKWNDCGGPSHGECGLDALGNPKCICTDPYTGPACADVKCSKQHCVHGSCANEKCVCEPGWKGPHCDYRVPCPAPGCGDGGRCVGDAAGVGKCVCEEGLTGPNCQDVICTDKCSGHGKCLNLGCVCDNGFHGEKCEITAPCPSGCNGHGVCTYDAAAKKSVCDCDDMWDSSSPTAGDCSVQRGRQWLDSNGHMQSQCNEPYYGDMCQSKRCEKPCQNNGICSDDGICDCPAGWSGDDCSIPLCPLGCSGGGECDVASKSCRCFTGYSGAGCENFSRDVCLASCQFKCSLRGSRGLVQVLDELGERSWVSARECHALCAQGQLCNVLFGSGHNTDGRTYVKLY